MTRSYNRYEAGVVWLRRDLRLDDNAALYEACAQSKGVCLAFVVDPALLQSDRMGAPLVCAFFSAVDSLREHLRANGSDLAILGGNCAEQLLALAKRAGAQAVFYNEDYEPDAIARDQRVERELTARGIAVHASADQVYFAPGEVLAQHGTPYKVFTPYKRRWLEQRAVSPRFPVPSKRALRGKLMSRSAIGETLSSPSPETFGFVRSQAYPQTSERIAHDLLTRFLREDGAVTRYKDERNVPALYGTSHLSPQLRAGTIGIRTCVERAFAMLAECTGAEPAGVEAWISELIWRDFYQMILRQFPHVASGPFLQRAENIRWRAAKRDFDAWCKGRTGYPIVDAAMRQLNTYGWMHNRLRMITASFLTKNLLVDWRRGERYFEQHLADADLAQNNGGWQWAASTGCDAAPYFRIFNPTLQGKRFDPDGVFVKRMLPELAHVPTRLIHEPWRVPQINYPQPIVDYAFSRERALAAFKVLHSPSSVRL